MSREAREWLVGRTPPPPEAFRPWGDAPETGAGLVADLTRGGLRALEAATSRPGRWRATAFRLLEADGFFTYACEAAAEEADPEEALEEALRAVGGGSRTP